MGAEWLGSGCVGITYARRRRRNFQEVLAFPLSLSLLAPLRYKLALGLAAFANIRQYDLTGCQNPILYSHTLRQRARQSLQSHFSCFYTFFFAPRLICGLECLYFYRLFRPSVLLPTHFETASLPTRFPPVSHVEIALTTRFPPASHFEIASHPL